MVGSNYKKWFLEYVKTYGDIPEVILKKEHSLRVAENMTSVFKNLGLSRDYVFLADFIGLFHDIGRFEQWHRYNTFYDAKSLDHGDFSADLLIKDGLLKELLFERIFDRIIYDAIKYHNKLCLPEDLSIKDEQLFKIDSSLSDYMKNYSSDEDEFKRITSLYAMAIRDIDKIDILNQYLLSHYLVSNSTEQVSVKVAESFFDNKSILKNDVNNVNDSMVLRLSFINDINLTQSLVLIKNNRFLEKIFTIYPNKKEVRNYFDYAEMRLNRLLQDNNGFQYVIRK